MKQWLEQLKAGDVVSISKPFGYPAVIGKVSRTTKTRIMVLCRPYGGNAHERAFRKDNGAEIPYRRDGLRLNQLETP